MQNNTPTGTLARATLLGGAARALAAHTTDIVGGARDTHALSPTAAAALGRMLTGAAIMASQLKGERDTLTLTARGGGPLGAITCVAKPDGDVKGYVDNPSADPPRTEQGKLNVGAAVGADGYLTVIKDLGYGEPYVGRTPLVSGEIAQDISHYLLHSEQTASMLALGVLVHPTEGVLGAGGILIQPLPGCGEEEIERLEALAPRLSSISRLAAETSSAQELLAACLEETSFELLECSPVRYHCGCGREKMERVLLSLGEDELRDMIEKQHGAEITCHFCATRYDFAEGELNSLIARAKE